jgi:hypothetical protein
MAAPDGQYDPNTANPPPIPLPPNPETDPLTAAQWGILAAIADTVVPSFTVSKGNRLLQHPLRNHVYEAAQNRIAHIAGTPVASSGEDLISAFLAESASAQPAFKHAMSRLVGYQMDDTARSGLLMVLNVLK